LRKLKKETPKPKEMPFISKLKKIIKIYKEFRRVKTRELQKEKVNWKRHNEISKPLSMIQISKCV
jgi:hypothetical protein